jgi:predicted lipoprotein with Yx(FWY)xxD motif
MRRVLVVALASAVTLLGCADNDDPASNGATTPAEQPTTEPTPTPKTASPTVTPTPTAQAPSGTTITVAGSQYGDVLFDATGQAIYLFDVEETSQPECYDACAAAWPPVLTEGPPVAAGAVDPALLGVSPRTDGSSQVTYAGHPLYFYAHEGKNEVRCHDVRGFGGLWLAVTPTGLTAPTGPVVTARPLRTTPSPESPSASDRSGSPMIASFASDTSEDLPTRSRLAHTVPAK